MEQLKELMEKMSNEFALFKQENDRRLKEIEAKGKADPLTEEKINKHSTALGELQKQLDEVQVKVQRKGGGGGDEDPKAKEKAEHRKAFDGFLRKGATDGLGELQAKATTIGSDPEGGYAVPDSIDREIERFERDNTPMRQLAKVITVSNENYEKLVNQGGASSGWVDELEARAETTTPALAALKPYFGEIYSNPGSSQKALDDAMFDVEAWLAEEVGLEFGEQENDAFTRGSGVKKPKGILAYTLSTSVDGTRTFGQIQNVNSGSSGNFVADKILDLIYALKRGYRDNAVMMMSALSVGAVRKLKDGQNNYLWQPTYVAGQPQMLAGYPVVENDDMPDPAAGSNSLVFGDIRRAYTIADVRGVRVLRDPFTAKPKVLFYTTKRVGGFLVNDRAVKVLTLT
jgi:HK97 family phage major capsid protein